MFVCVFFGQGLVHILLRPLWQRESLFDETEALIPNQYNDEEDEEHSREIDRNSERSISEHAVNSSDDDLHRFHSRN
jgi:hypothetical protein